MFPDQLTISYHWFLISKEQSIVTTCFWSELVTYLATSLSISFSGLNLQVIIYIVNQPVAKNLGYYIYTTVILYFLNCVLVGFYRPIRHWTIFVGLKYSILNIYRSLCIFTAHYRLMEMTPQFDKKQKLIWSFIYSELLNC